MGSGASRDIPPENGEERKKKSAKIPLNIALVAIVKIQVRFRMKVARRKFEEMRKLIMEQRMIEELVRKSKVPERDEITPMKTSAMSYLCSSAGEVNAKNRFIRKTGPEHRVKFGNKYSTAIKSSGKPQEFDPALALVKCSPFDAAHTVIYPLVGFVIKSRCNTTGKKIFFNICHHETIATMVSAPVREVSDIAGAELVREAAATISRRPSFASFSGRPYTANSSSKLNISLMGAAAAGDTLGKSERMLIADIVLPSAEFEECFRYDEDEGLLPISPAVRLEMARQTVKYWNITHKADISDSCTFPKIKRGYFGDLLPLLLDVKDKSVTYLPSALRAWSAQQQAAAAETLNHHQHQSMRGGDSLLSLSHPPGGDENDRFRLPWATPLSVWVDAATVGNRVALMNNDLPAGSSAVSALALVEPTKARKSASTHTLMFTSTALPAGVVECVVPARLPGLPVPLFGPAYATQLLSMQQAQSSAAEVTEGSTDVSKSSNTKAPAVGTSSTVFTPHTPSGSKTTRAMTMGAIGTGFGAGAGSEVARTPHRHLTGAAAGGAWNKAATTNSTTAITAAAVDEDDEDPAGSFVPIATASAPAAVDTPKAGSRSAYAGLAALRKQEEINAAVVASTDSALLLPVPSECNTSMPVFLLLSGGVLYVYNRDPVRSGYFPRNPPRPAPKEPEPKTGKRSEPAAVVQEEIAPTPSVTNPAEYLPLIQYARIALTEESVLMSTEVVEGARTWRIHIRPASAETASAEDTIAFLYTQIHEAFRNAPVTLTMRSYSEFRTWKAHLRVHIQLSNAVRHRVVTEYGATAVIAAAASAVVSAQTHLNNQSLAERPAPKLGELMLLHSRQKVFAKIDHGILCLYEGKHPEEFTGRNLLRTIELVGATVKLRNEMLEDNSSENILSLLDATGRAIHQCGEFCSLLISC